MSELQTVVQKEVKEKHWDLHDTDMQWSAKYCTVTQACAAQVFQDSDCLYAKDRLTVKSAIRKMLIMVHMKYNTSNTYQTG